LVNKIEVKEIGEKWEVGKPRVLEIFYPGHVDHAANMQSFPLLAAVELSVPQAGSNTQTIA
jgi:hypothetical protein